MFLSSILKLVAAITLSFLLTGCGSANEANDNAQHVDHNADDVKFAQDMIPHHEQAIEMSDLATDRIGSAEVGSLAQRIKAAQAPEIEQMKGWLESWEEPVYVDGHEGEHGHGTGMLAPDEIAQLHGASGTDFDRKFLTGMIEHHKGAITMAGKELKDGKHQGAKALAQNIIKSQEAEIAEMNGLLTQLPK